MNKKAPITLSEEIIKKVSGISTGERKYESVGIDKDLITYKVEHIIDMFSRNLEDAKDELRGYFTESEALEVVSCFTSTIYGIDISCKTQLISAIEGHFYYDVPVACLEEDRKNLVEKIKRLSSFQAYIVMYMAKEYLNLAILIDEGNSKLKEVFMVSN